MSSEKVMNAVRFHGREDLRFEQVPEPECGKGQIKIKPAWCGICGRVRIWSVVVKYNYRRANTTEQFVPIPLFWKTVQFC